MKRIVELDELTAEVVQSGSLSGLRVTVLGLARSGLAMARFFDDAGARVTVYDGRSAEELAAAVDSLSGRSIELALGPEVKPATAWAGADLVATSPSINPDYPTTEPRLRAALRDLVEAHRASPRTAPALVSEADLVLRMCPCPTVGVTGTKGKTTTASLTATLLAADVEHPAILGGNIGLPLIERLPELTLQHRVVIELSELQLPTLSRGTTVAVYTNVTSDHLDRHGSLQAYRTVKRRLAELVDPAGALVLNAEDPVVASYAGGAAAPAVFYRRSAPLPGGVGVANGWITAAGVRPLACAGVRPLAPGGAGAAAGDPIMPVSELAIPGAHNVSNALAAISAALLFGIPASEIRRAAAAFRGVEHRLERVAVVDGVQFINDSQGTQPDAVVAALRSFDRPLVLIAGGRDKGNDLSALGPVAAERADAVVLIGESGPALAELFRASGVDRVEMAASLEEAVRLAEALAREALAVAGSSAGLGLATVLLSPAAASFDMFVDYADRGAAFRAAAEAMEKRRRIVRSRR
jgi:UDP-N-acetylmuramoylalanine--D-glutamate ligase